MELDLTTPGGVYLCQVSENISCGACCGLYNVEDAGFEYLDKILKKRKELFAETKRDADSILEFAEKIQKTESQKRPFYDFHHCPYVGYIAENRIGCLLHPLGDGNSGVDFRGLSYYGGFACRSYFCETCKKLTKEYKRIIRSAAENWHIYGLIITEYKMIDNFFGLIEKRTGKKLNEKMFINTEAAKCIQDFMGLKVNWPYRENNFKSFGNYFFEEKVHPTPEIDYSRCGNEKSRFNEIFKALNSVFNNREELLKAEEIIETLVEKLRIQLNI